MKEGIPSYKTSEISHHFYVTTTIQSLRLTVIIKLVQSDLVITVKKLNEKKLSLRVVSIQIRVKYGQTQNWLKLQLKNVQLKVKVEVGFKFEITFAIFGFVHTVKNIFSRFVITKIFSFVKALKKLM